MKKLLVVIIFYLSLSPVLVTRQTAAAQIAEDFPYEGIYLTDENRIIRGFIFEETGLQILLRREDLRDSETKNTERLDNLIQAGRQNDSLTGMLDPTMNAEDVEKWREENLNFPDYAKIYAEVAEQITPDMTREAIDALIDAQDPGLDFTYLQFNYINPIFHQFIKVNAPTIEQSQNLWIVRINTERLLRFEYDENTDGNTITDDYGVTYTKHDELPNEH